MAYTAQVLGQPVHLHASSTHAHYNGFPDVTLMHNQVTVQDDDAISARTDSTASTFTSAGQAVPAFELVRKGSVRSQHAPLALQHHDYKIDIYSVGVNMESKITGTRFDPEQFRVEAEAPSGRVVRMTGDGHYAAQFTPDEIGRWRVSMFYNNRFMDGCPVDVCDPSQVRVRDLRGGLVGKQQTFHVDCTGAGQGDLGVDITHAGKRIPVYLTETSTPRLFKVAYTPYDPGPYEVNVHFNRAEVRDSDFHSTDPEERQRRAVFNTKVDYHANVVKISASCDWEIDYVTGGPFVVHVTDSSDIQVYGMKDGTICSSPELIADCSKVGDGTLTAEVTHNGLRFPCKVRKDRPGVYRLSFKPRGPGTYKIWISYDGLPVKGSPFIQEIAELGRPAAHGDGLYRGVPGRPLNFTVDPRGNPGPVSVDITGPSQNVPCHLAARTDGTVLATYTPLERGPHTVDVRVEGKPVEGSPFEPSIVDPASVRVSGGWRSLVDERGIIPLRVNKEKHLPFDTSEAGPGDLTAEVRGPSGKIPVTIDARNDGKHTVIFTSREEGQHFIDVKWGGFPVVNSPFEGFATYQPEPVIAPEHEIVSLRQIPLKSAPAQALADKDIIPLKVGQEKELSFDTTRQGPGKLTGTVRGPSGQLPVVIDNRVEGRPTLRFTPEEEGKHMIDVNWNNTPLTQSPFVGYATHDPNNNQSPNVYLFGPPQSNKRSSDSDKDIIPLQVQKQKELPFDASSAGPGQLTATVHGPTKPVPAAVQDTGDGKPVLFFTPEEEGKHDIHVRWNGVPIPQSPLIGYATREPRNGTYPSGPPPVYLFDHSPRNKRSSDSDKDIIPLQVQKQKELPFDSSSAGPGQLTATVHGPTKPVPAAVQDTGDGKPVLFFTPEEEGKHDIHVRWNGVPIPQSPLIGYATREPRNGTYPSGPPPVYLFDHSPRSSRSTDEPREMIPLKVQVEKELPFDTSGAGPGALIAGVRGPSRPIPASVRDRGDGKPTVHFTPEEEGKHYIDVKWNGSPIPQSPLIGYATRDPPKPKGPPPVYLAGHKPRHGQPMDDDVDIIPLKVNQEKQLPFDATEAGPGKMTAAVRGPSRNIPVHVEDRNNGRPTLRFTPEEEGKHLIDVNWNDQPAPKSPFVGYATKDPELIVPSLAPPAVMVESYPKSVQSSRPSSILSDREPLKVVLRGRGLKEAEINKPAVFHVDGTRATPGSPQAHLDGVRSHIPVTSTPEAPQVYKCTYVPKLPGAYLLHVKWNDQPLRGSPFKVNVRAPEQPTQGRVHRPETAKPGRVGSPVEFKVDHPDPSKLTVTCTDPKGNLIPCRFLDNLDGTSSLKMTPHMPGKHVVDIRFNNQHIMGSPYIVDIKATEQHGRVRVWGPGIAANGVLNNFESNFWVDATGAGAGELRVRIMGPKGAFHVKMRKASQKEKLYQCFYDPVEAGIYTIYVQWSGAHVDGSPFTLLLANSAHELDVMTDDRLSVRTTPTKRAPSPRDPGMNDMLY